MNINIDSNPKDVFYDFLNSSVINYVGAGSSGLGVLASNATNDSYKILTTDNKNVVCSKIFVKIVPIYTDMDARIQPSFSLLLPGMYSASIYSNAEIDFWNEVYLQSKIYKKTNEFLEAVCPPIVYSECLDNASSIEMLKKLFSLVDNASEHDMSDDPMFELYNRYYMNNSTLKLGIIGMGFTEGYTSLYSMFRSNYPNITRYFDLAIYELLRLYSAGYIHGDFSLANVMINTDYNYTGTNSGRAMLIDFGMTFKHNYKDRDIPVILQKMLDTKTPFSSITPREHRNYRWFVNYITNNLEDITISIKNLNQMITAHIHKMVDMIDITYPEVLARIRTYNDTEQHNNIFNGGFKNHDDVYEVENKMFVSNPMMSKPESKSKTLSIIEFNRIFNPNNLNIPQLLDAYLRTLNLGEQTISSGIKSVKGKKGGKKQKRPSQNRKRKHKQKTKRRHMYRSKKTYKRHR
jgi:hypothetical protein